MTPASKGRWVGFATVAAVTIAWALMTAGHGSAVLTGGIYIGIPYGLFAGSLLGRSAGRLQRFRSLVIAEALAWWLPIEVPARSLFDLDPIWSLVPTLVAALVLEQWTRPVELVPRAAVLRV